MQINRIYHEDCRETMRRMPDDFIDLVVTSPPYDNLRKYKGNVVWNETVWREILELAFMKVKVGGVIVWVVADATINGSETGTSFKQALYAKEIGFNLHDTMIWHKHTIPLTHNRYEPSFEYMFVFSKGKPKTFNPILVNSKSAGNKERPYLVRNTDIGSASKGKSKAFGKKRKQQSIKENTWTILVGHGLTSTDKEAFDHPAPFPEKLAADHIYSWSNEGDLVYDPFIGSGTVAKMADKMKRNWIGSDIAGEYVELSNKRLDKYIRQTKIC